MFKVNNKDTRATSLTSFWCFFIVNFEHIFLSFSIVSVVDFEQVILEKKNISLHICLVLIIYLFFSDPPE